MKVIIAGGRDFKDYSVLRDYCDKILSRQDKIEIVSGNAKGADKLGERYALEKGFLLKILPADWDKYGKKAGYMRNVDMADYADGLIAFWNGTSKGTKHMIETAESKKLKIRIKYY